MFEYQTWDTSTGTAGSAEQRVSQMEQYANEMGRLGWRWVRTDGPLMVFERQS